MTEREFTDLLSHTPRTLSAQEVERIEQQRDADHGLWVGNQVDHHEYGESHH